VNLFKWIIFNLHFWAASHKVILKKKTTSQKEKTPPYCFLDFPILKTHPQQHTLNPPVFCLQAMLLCCIVILPTLSGLTHRSQAKRNWNWDKEAQPSNGRSFMGSNFGELFCKCSLLTLSEMSVVELACCYPTNPKKLCAYARLRNGGVQSQKLQKLDIGHVQKGGWADGSNKSNSSDSWILIHPNMVCIL